MMDRDKDGIIGKNDLRDTFNQLGRLVAEKELDEMINEAPGPINFTQLLQLFANRMSGGLYISASTITEIWCETLIQLSLSYFLYISN